MSVADFEKRTGYAFKNPKLLEQALTHSSYANEKKLGSYCDNERLEFLGDAVLELVTSEFLYNTYPDIPEGELSKTRAALVCEPTLAYCAMEMGLGTHILLGKGEEATGGRARKSVLSDALEATIGAIYLDGGLEMARAYIMQFILNDIEHKRMFHDSKTMLQEAVQAASKKIPEYRIAKEYGPSHEKTYEVEVMVDGRVLASGSGRSKKAAEQEAAYRALLDMKKCI